MQSWSTYATPADVFVRSTLACHGVGVQSGHFRPMRPRTLPTHGLVVISRGRGTYRGMTATTQPIRSPALLWLFPGAEHSYWPDAQGWTEHWILFGGQTCEVFEELHLWDADRPVVSLDHLPPAMGQLFDEIRRSSSSSTSTAQLAVSVHCAQVLLLAVTAAAESVDIHRRLPARILEQFSADATSNLSMSERARRLGISVPDLRAMVRGTTGRTPHEHLTQIRMSKAQGLLAETVLTVAQIATQVGFDDAAYFSRYFNRRVGVPPTVFRRQRARQVDG